MRIKDGFDIKNIDGQYVVVSVSGDTDRFDASISLGETSVFLWRLLKARDCSKTEMLDALLNAFEISTVLALGNIDIFVRTLKEYGIIE